MQVRRLSHVSFFRRSIIVREPTGMPLFSTLPWSLRLMPAWYEGSLLAAALSFRTKQRFMKFSPGAWPVDKFFRHTSDAEACLASSGWLRGIASSAHRWPRFIKNVVFCCVGRNTRAFSMRSKGNVVTHISRSTCELQCVASWLGTNMSDNWLLRGIPVRCRHRSAGA